MKKAFAAITFLLSALMFNGVAHAELQTKIIQYSVDGESFTGYLAFDDSISGKRPGVLVVHEWWGHNDYVRERADMLAKLGYTAFALDMYGSGKVAQHPDDAKKFMEAVSSNISLGEKRFEAGYNLLRNQATVDASKIAAIGYCFGGGTVLHMAREGYDLKGVVNFHGGLGTETPAKKGNVKADILVFIGEADPMIPAEQVEAFRQEMSNASVDAEVYTYPGVKHSFTNPSADEFGKRFKMPLAYDAKADADSWSKMQQFFRSIF